MIDVVTMVWCDCDLDSFTNPNSNVHNTPPHNTPHHNTHPPSTAPRMLHLYPSLPTRQSGLGDHFRSPGSGLQDHK